MAKHSLADLQARYADLGSYGAVAREFGMDRRNVARRLRGIDEESSVTSIVPKEIEVTPPTPYEMPADELLAQRTLRWERKQQHEAERALIPVKINKEGPIGILHLGDPHIDDDGTDIVALQQHVKLVQETDGLYVANVGDSTNAWIGRLAKLYGDQSTTAAEAWILADWLFRACKGKWLYAIGGNHDLWEGAGDPLKWITAQADALYQPSECRIELELPKGPRIIINARHDFAGHSQWNPAHGAMKAAQFGCRDHIMICGHKHVSGYGIVKCPSTGRLSHCIQVASYKVHDRYARERGFRDQHVSPCVVTIIDPSAKKESGLIQVFHDPLLAARVLKAMRGGA